MNGPFLPSHVARCAVLAMVLEVSGTPKPGNIDREHDYADTKYEDFLASAIGVSPILENGCTEGGIGGLILAASEEERKLLTDAGYAMADWTDEDDVQAVGEAGTRQPPQWDA